MDFKKKYGISFEKGILFSGKEPPIPLKSINLISSYQERYRFLFLYLLLISINIHTYTSPYYNFIGYGSFPRDPREFLFENLIFLALATISFFIGVNSKIFLRLDDGRKIEIMNSKKSKDTKELIDLLKNEMKKNNLSYFDEKIQIPLIRFRLFIGTIFLIFIIYYMI